MWGIYQPDHLLKNPLYLSQSAYVFTLIKKSVSLEETDFLFLIGCISAIKLYKSGLLSRTYAMFNRPDLCSYRFRYQIFIPLNVVISNKLAKFADTNISLFKRDLYFLWILNSLALNVQITYIRRLITDPAVTIASIKKKGYVLSVESR